MKLKTLMLAILVGMLLLGCGGGSNDDDSGSSPSPAPLTRPVANAGLNQYCTPGQTITFDGSASYDTDGDVLTYRWEIVEHPSSSQAVLIDPASSSPSLTIDVEGIYELQLVVNDGSEDSLPDTVKAATSTMLIDTAPDKIAIDGEDVVYLLNSSNSRVYRWSLLEQFPLNPIDVGTSPQLMTYSSAAQRLYLGYDSGAITQIDLSSGTREMPFATLPDSPHGLAGAGNYILAADPSGAWNTHYIYALDGSLMDSVDWNERSSEYAWNPVNSRIYFFRDGISPNDLHYEEIDQSTGLISAAGETPYHGDYVIQPPIRVSKDGTRVLLGAGDIYDADSLTLVKCLPIEPVEAAWMDTGLLTIRTSQDGNTLLEQWNTDLMTLYNVQSFAGQPLRVFEWQGGIGVITLVSGKPEFYTYAPADDGDGDGVPYSQDAFPLDPAASVDSDGDGYPDAWNPGYSAADSTTGLELDAFPNDSACQLPSQGLPGDPSVCDIASAIPQYTPDDIRIGDDDVVYLLSTTNDRVYRWSLTQDDHLNPIYVGTSPQLMTYSSAAQRLYLGYGSGAITQIDLSSGTRETPFATLPDSPHGLAGAGNYILAADPSGAWNTHYIYALDGSLMDSVDWNERSREYAWNPVNSRIYFFRDGISPNDLHYEEIDQSTGLISAAGETPYHGDYVIQPPIRVSKDGTRVLLGAGDIYDADSLTWVNLLPLPVTDAAWTTIGLFSIRTSLDGRTLLERWNTDLTLNSSQYFDGQPLRVFEGQSDIRVITLVDGKPEFNSYVP